MSSTPDIGSIIPSGTARKLVYGIYASGALVVGGVVAYFLSTGIPIPVEVTGAQGVIAYLAIPIGGLALANTSNPPAMAITNVYPPADDSAKHSL